MHVAYSFVGGMIYRALTSILGRRSSFIDRRAETRQGAARIRDSSRRGEQRPDMRREYALLLQAIPARGAVVEVRGDGCALRVGKRIVQVGA